MITIKENKSYQQKLSVDELEDGHAYRRIGVDKRIYIANRLSKEDTYSPVAYSICGTNIVYGCDSDYEFYEIDIEVIVK